MKLEALDSQRNIQNVLTRGIGFSPGKGSPIRLTAKDRVLLHIAEHPVDAEAPTVPAALTQEGIAEHSGFARRHFSILVGPLLRDGLLRERVAHVLGIRQRRKVYELTWSGRLEATRLRQTLESEMVPVQNDGRLLEARVSTLIEESGGTPSLARIAVQLSRNGFVDRGLLAAGSPRVEMLADAPRVGRFVGRTAELAEILKEDRGARITVVQGIAGIGKTSLAAQVCHDLRGRTNLFWHRVRPWDTFESILSSLSRFLSALGLKSLAGTSRPNRTGPRARPRRSRGAPRV